MIAALVTNKISHDGTVNAIKLGFTNLMRRILIPEPWPIQRFIYKGPCNIN